MSNQAYIAYLTAVMTKNTADQTNNGYSIAGLQASVNNFTTQIENLRTSISGLEAANIQLAADNVLLGNLIQQLQASK